MGDPHRAGLQLRLDNVAGLALDPGRADRCSGFTLESKRQVHDGIAQVTRLLPVLVGGARVGSKKSEVDALELFRADALDKVHLVAERLELTERFIVVKQPDIDCGKIPFAQDLGNLFALKRRRADYGHTIEVSAAQICLSAGGLRKSSFGGGVMECEMPPDTPEVQGELSGGRSTASATKLRKPCIESQSQKARDPGNSIAR